MTMASPFKVVEFFVMFLISPTLPSNPFVLEITSVSSSSSPRRVLSAKSTIPSNAVNSMAIAAINFRRVGLISLSASRGAGRIFLILVATSGLPKPPPLGSARS
jgi:hypothetical protein